MEPFEAKTAGEDEDAAELEVEVPKKKKKSRRIDSARDVEQEWDSENEVWVDV